MNQNDVFVLRLNSRNAAFKDAGETVEVARILRELADKLENSSYLHDGNLRDINGNVTGQYYVSKNDGEA